MNTKYGRIQFLIFILLSSASMMLQAAISGTGGIATRAFTGTWNQLMHPNESTIIQIVNDDAGALSGKVYWIVYDEDGIPYWYFAEGPVTDNRIDLTIYEATDPAVTPEPGGSNLRVVGDGAIEFDNCFEGTFSGLDSISGTGGFHFKINKMSGIADTTCSGGTSDGVNPSDSPVDIRSFFTSTVAGAGSSGKAEFEISGGRTNFNVEIEDLPVGDYDLSVDGIKHGSVRVVALSGGGTKGEIEFRSPVEPEKVLLTFDPRDKLIDISNSASDIVLTQIFPSSFVSGEDGLAGGADMEIRTDLTNAGVYPAGDADAQFEQRPDRAAFSVEVEDIPAGIYDLYVGSVMRGTINVVQLSGGTEGEIEFRSPVEAGKVLLDFDPRNQLIEVKQDNTLLFSTDFPSGTDPVVERVVLDIGLENTGVDGQASGTLEYRKFGTRTRIEIRVEDLSVNGRYQVFIDDIMAGNLPVEDGKGRWEFRTRFLDKAPFPDGNPVGAVVSVRFNGVDMLSVRIPE